MRAELLSLSILFASSLCVNPGSVSSHTPVSSIESRDKDRSERERMVEHQVIARGIVDPRVLDAMRRVPRDHFVPEAVRSQAYADHPLPIAEGQTISQPYVVAWMTEALELHPDDRVLEIGTGSGYQAAVLAEIAKEVYSIEIRPSLAKYARENLKANGYGNVEVREGDGYDGWKEHAPFDAIIITCAANHVPPPLLGQLKVGGRLILPLGSTTYFQNLTLITKAADGARSRQLGGVTFVPMVGKMDR